MASHDKFFRALLQEEGAAEALLRERLPRDTVAQFAAKPQVLPRTFIERTLKERVTDVLIRVPLRGGDAAFVYCLVEHKRTNERAVMLQLLRYLSAIYERLATQFPIDAMPVVVPLVVYNGVAPWRGGRRFRALLRGAPRSLRLSLDFGVVLVDLGRERATSLSRNDTLRGGLTALKVAAAPAETRQALITATLDDLKGEASTRSRFLHYVMDVVDGAERQLLRRTLREHEGERRMYSIADGWKAQGYRKGKKLGMERGLARGLARGLEKGLQKGLEQGLRQAVTQILSTRFKRLSAAHEARLADADAEELNALLVRATKAKRLSDVFPARAPART